MRGMITVIVSGSIQGTKDYYTHVQNRDATDIRLYVGINNTSSVALSWIVRDNHPLFIGPLWKTDNVEQPTRVKRNYEPHASPTKQINRPNVKQLLVLDECEAGVNWTWPKKITKEDDDKEICAG